MESFIPPARMPSSREVVYSGKVTFMPHSLGERQFLNVSSWMKQSNYKRTLFLLTVLMQQTVTSPLEVYFAASRDRKPMHHLKYSVH